MCANSYANLGANQGPDPGIAGDLRCNGLGWIFEERFACKLHMVSPYVVNVGGEESGLEFYFASRLSGVCVVGTSEIWRKFPNFFVRCF